MVRTKEQIKAELENTRNDTKKIVDATRKHISKTSIEQQSLEIQNMLDSGNKSWQEDKECMKQQIANGTFRVSSIDSMDGVIGFLKREDIVE